ncbi:hypothetical protein ITP53_23075 [Nonomuraea sp. K274]|uniref:DivIVA domain-containing protein n=1 Tax=Nonomuraea cypriaca TaxID=1187855 RepID=A0A931F1W2_9ACTN|nr:hypothetical protein [Nonomuraea cypriaca]MBF8188556.1 hypothetical protein [Nonomuraea cypriaca]
MLVILAIAAIAILACVVLVSLGRGGELTEFPPDVPPLDLPEPGQLTAVDFMALQLPVNLVGYHTASVDETLRKAAGAISARDTRIAVLEQRVAELLSSRLHARQEVYAAPGAGMRTDHSPEAPAGARELPESGDPVSASGAAVSWDGSAGLRRPPEDAEWRVNHTAMNTSEPKSDTPGEPATEAREPAADVKPDDPTDAAGEAGDETADEDVKLKSDAAEPEDEVAEPAGKEAEPEGEPGEPGGEPPDGQEEPVRAALGKDGDERR